MEEQQNLAGVQAASDMRRGNLSKKVAFSPSVIMAIEMLFYSEEQLNFSIVQLPSYSQALRNRNRFEIGSFSSLMIMQGV